MFIYDAINLERLGLSSLENFYGYMTLKIYNTPRLCFSIEELNKYVSRGVDLLNEVKICDYGDDFG